ncbi:MAG TPA: mRNA interferase MazF2 [Treponema sp.]|nr:mRNA interferase MazF2 [Treponema sp.]
MTRGELWWADFGIPFGSEPGFKRPVLIVQNDFFNKSKINTTIVIPLTTNMILADAPGNIILPKKESKLKKDSVIAVSQIAVIDKQRLIEKITKTGEKTIEQIEHNMLFILGINKINEI